MFIPDLTFDERLKIARCMLQYSTSFGDYSYSDIDSIAISLMKSGDYWTSANRINSKLRPAPDQVSNTLTNNHCRYVRVSSHTVRHDRCIYHPQIA